MTNKELVQEYQNKGFFILKNFCKSYRKNIIEFNEKL